MEVFLISCKPCLDELKLQQDTINVGEEETNRKC